MGRWVAIEEGTIDITPRYEGDKIREHIIPGTFPRRYVDLVYLEDDEELPPGVEVHIDGALPRVSQCERCQREIRPMYRYCYRCFNYLQTKKRIAAA